MNICKKCLKHYEDVEKYTSPVEELAELFLRSTNKDETDQLCPNCKEEIGLMNLAGFRP